MEDSSLRNKLNDMYETADQIKEYSVTEEYKRALYEDKNAMKECMDTFYNGKKSQVDPLTGNLLHRDGGAAERKYGREMASSHKGHPDHDDPLAKIHERHKHTDYLNDDDLKLAGNRKDNLIAKQAKANISKRDDYNVDAMRNPNKAYGNELKPKAKAVEVVRGEKNKLETDAILYGKSAQRRLYVSIVTGIKEIDDFFQVFRSEEFKRMNEAGIDAATAAAIFAGTMSVVSNTFSVIRGEEDGKEAAKNIVVDTVGAGSIAYVTKIATDGISNGLGVSTGTAALIATGTVQISKNVASYLKGEITSEQLQEKVLETSAMLVAGYIGKSVGSFVGRGIGTAIGTVICPGAGTLIGEEVGAQIGAFVGEIITSAVCVEVIGTLKYSKEFSKQNSHAIMMAHRAEDEIRKSQERLKNLIKKENMDFLEKTDVGFAQMMQGIYDCNYNDVKMGILQIGSKFGMTEEELTEGTVKKGHIFDHQSDVLVIS